MKQLIAIGVTLALVNAPTGAEAQKGKGSSSSQQKAAKSRAQTDDASAARRALERNPRLASRVAERLPAKIDVMWAASGFRNLGQFVAAVNAADNLEIPFVTLKSRLLERGMTLGQAIRTLRPSVDYRQEAERAEREAREMIGKAER